VKEESRGRGGEGEKKGCVKIELMVFGLEIGDRMPPDYCRLLVLIKQTQAVLVLPTNFSGDQITSHEFQLDGGRCFNQCLNLPNAR